MEPRTKMPATKEESRTMVRTELLQITSRDLLKELHGNVEAKSVRAMAYKHWDEVLQQDVEVHILVTRDATQFLEPFQTEVII